MTSWFLGSKHKLPSLRVRKRLKYSLLDAGNNEQIHKNNKKYLRCLLLLFHIKTYCMKPYTPCFKIMSRYNKTVNISNPRMTRGVTISVLITADSIKR